MPDIHAGTQHWFCPFCLAPLAPLCHYRALNEEFKMNRLDSIVDRADIQNSTILSEI